MGVGLAIEVTTNFWIEEDAFQEDTMVPGVRETIKLWTQAGTSSEPSVGVIYGRGALEEMTKGSSLCGGAQAMVLRLCAHDDPSQQSFETSVLTLIHDHH